MIEPANLLASRGRRLLENHQSASDIRAEYRREGVVQVDDFADPERLSRLGDTLYRELAELALPTALRHEVRHADGKSVLGSGHRFGRIDPDFLPPSDPRRACLEEAIDRIGLLRFGAAASELLTPLVRFVVGRRVVYQKVYLFLYHEGDYIGPHTDKHTGDRVNVQIPIARAAATGFRVLKNGSLDLYYDHAGCLRILGPEVWHEVLPVLRLRPDTDPYRILLSLRYR